MIARQRFEGAQFIYVLEPLPIEVLEYDIDEEEIRNSNLCIFLIRAGYIPVTPFFYYRHLLDTLSPHEAETLLLQALYMVDALFVYDGIAETPFVKAAISLAKSNQLPIGNSIQKLKELLDADS